MTVTNVTRKTVLAADCKTASTFFARLRGLQFRKRFPPGHGLLLVPCNSIHTFFMRFPIDAVFLDRENRVVHICEGIKPWRVSGMIRSARCVLELPAGTVSATGTARGDMLDIQS
ncbi:MAG: DUF192 domain-containing protein [Clostridiaceae bacterium]|jgi:uncharacterized membrane protein (UPF0127 family)|nr:DUF192 domain-containing protein [Clostridiaceae bacterium]